MLRCQIAYTQQTEVESLMEVLVRNVNTKWWKVERGGEHFVLYEVELSRKQRQSQSSY
jgi:hypothetical protein